MAAVSWSPKRAETSPPTQRRKVEDVQEDTAQIKQLHAKMEQLEAEYIHQKLQLTRQIEEAQTETDDLARMHNVIESKLKEKERTNEQLLQDLAQSTEIQRQLHEAVIERQEQLHEAVI